MFKTYSAIFKIISTITLESNIRLNETFLLYFEITEKIFAFKNYQFRFLILLAIIQLLSQYR